MKITYCLGAALLFLTLTACNTFEGVGQDVEAAGDAIGDLARDTEDALED